MKLTAKQQEIVGRIKAGEELVYIGYSPGIHLPAHCFWEKERATNIGDQENPVRTVKALLHRKIAELQSTEIHGEFHVILKGGTSP